MLVRDAAGTVKKIAVQSAPSHNYILGVDFQGDDIWVATAKGLKPSEIRRQKSSDRNEQRCFCQLSHEVHCTRRNKY